MTPASEILKLIETVSPDDTGKLDEIDLLVGQWIGLFPYQQPYTGHPINQYTSSRDALKKIRPEGWDISIQSYDFSYDGKCEPPHWSCNISKIGGKTFYGRHKSPTEELAELHAIIQAIEHERGTAQ